MPPGKTTMQTMPIDSTESLEAADLPPGAARAIVRVIADHVDAAVSNLATKDDVERLRLDVTNEFERSRLATTNQIQASGSAMKSDFAEFRSTMKSEFDEFRLATKSDFDEFRVYIHRLFLKWSMALFGALISSYAALVFLVIQHLQK
jgi:hypothetical protein